MAEKPNWDPPDGNQWLDQYGSSGGEQNSISGYTSADPAFTVPLALDHSEDAGATSNPLEWVANFGPEVPDRILAEDMILPNAASYEPANYVQEASAVVHDEQGLRKWSLDLYGSSGGELNSSSGYTSADPTFTVPLAWDRSEDAGATSEPLEWVPNFGPKVPGSNTVDRLLAEGMTTLPGAASFEPANYLQEASAMAAGQQGFGTFSQIASPSYTFQVASPGFATVDEVIEFFETQKSQGGLDAGSFPMNTQENATSHNDGVAESTDSPAGSAPATTTTVMHLVSLMSGLNEERCRWQKTAEEERREKDALQKVVDEERREKDAMKKVVDEERREKDAMKKELEAAAKEIGELKKEKEAAAMEDDIFDQDNAKRKRKRTTPPLHTTVTRTKKHVSDRSCSGEVSSALPSFPTQPTGATATSVQTMKDIVSDKEKKKVKLLSTEEKYEQDFVVELKFSANVPQCIRNNGYRVSTSIQRPAATRPEGEWPINAQATFSKGDKILSARFVHGWPRDRGARGDVTIINQFQEPCAVLGTIHFSDDNDPSNAAGDQAVRSTGAKSFQSSISREFGSNSGSAGESFRFGSSTGQSEGKESSSDGDDACHTCHPVSSPPVMPDHQSSLESADDSSSLASTSEEEKDDSKTQCRQGFLVRRKAEGNDVHRLDAHTAGRRLEAAVSAPTTSAENTERRSVDEGKASMNLRTWFTLALWSSAVIYLLIFYMGMLSAPVSMYSEQTRFNQAVDQFGKTPLHIAAEKCNTQCIQALVATGSDPNATVKDGRTPLHVAAHAGNVQSVQALLVAGSDPNANAEDGRTPLHVAVHQDDVLSVQALLAAGSDPNAKTKDGRTPLHVAAKTGNTECAQILLVAGSDPNARTKFGKSPLHHAASSDNVQSIQALLAAGSDPNAQTQDGETPLHHAASADNVQSVQALLAAGSDPDAQTKDGETTVHLAASSDNVQSIQALLAAGSDPNAQTQDGSTPLHFAAGCYAYNMPPTGAEGSDFNAKTKTLRITSFEGGVLSVQALLTAGSDPNAKTKDGRTPLHVAASSDNRKSIQALLAAGSDPNAQTKDGSTPLHFAAGCYAYNMPPTGAEGSDFNAKTKTLRITSFEGGVLSVQALLAAGSDPNAKTKDGRTPLHVAASSDNRKSIQALLAAGSNPNAQTKDGSTPLHFAAGCYAYNMPPTGAEGSDFNAKTKILRITSFEGGAQSVQALLAAGSDPNTKTKDGITPLYFAASSGNRKSIQALLAAGSDPNAETKEIDPLDGSPLEPLRNTERGSHRKIFSEAEPDGATPLHAVWNCTGCAKSSQALLAAGADAAAKTEVADVQIRQVEWTWTSNYDDLHELILLNHAVTCTLNQFDTPFSKDRAELLKLLKILKDSWPKLRRTHRTHFPDLEWNQIGAIVYAQRHMRMQERSVTSVTGGKRRQKSGGARNGGAAYTLNESQAWTLYLINRDGIAQILPLNASLALGPQAMPL